MVQHAQTAPQTAPQTPHVTSPPHPQTGERPRGLRVQTGIRAGYDLSRSFDSTFESHTSVSRSYHSD